MTLLSNSVVEILDFSPDDAFSDVLFLLGLQIMSISCTYIALAP